MTQTEKEMCIKNNVWVTYLHKRVKISNMSHTHIKNVIFWINKGHKTYLTEYHDQYLDKFKKELLKRKINVKYIV